MFQGNYLFHLHTERTDGKLFIQDYFAAACRCGARSIIFLEHIRKYPGYDVEAFVKEIRDSAREAGVDAFIGFETRLLPNGSLDISDKHLELAEVIGIAEHGFPDNVELLKLSFLKVLDLYRYKMRSKNFVWVHPGLWFKRRGMNPAHSLHYLSMLAHAQKADLLIERNLRYGLIDESLVSQITPSSLVVGADAHTAEDLKVWTNWQSSYTYQCPACDCPPAGRAVGRQ